MAARDADPSLTLSPADWRRIDSACDQFDADWRCQQRPNIAAHLAEVEERLRPALSGELIRLEMEWRLRSGEQASAEQYLTEYPDHAASLPSWLEHATKSVAALTASSASLLQDDTATAGSTPTEDFVESTPAEPVVRQLGEYDLIERLGVGGMGEVWKARHRRLGKPVALKLILASNAQKPDAVQRFVREMKAIGRLDHPNVVDASDAGEWQGTIYLAMKLIQGQDLAQYVKARGPLPAAEACDLARQVASGLQYLHEQGLVHRDLKPANLMRTVDGTVKILDLGLARWHESVNEDVGDRTQVGTGLGTPDYVAPEQVAHASTVDVRADLYSLGATLFYLLTGQPPFGHVQGSFEKLKAHESQSAPNVRAIMPSVPIAVSQLIARLLSKDPADRPRTPAEVVDVLTKLSGDDPPSISLADIRPRRRRTILVWTGVVAALVPALWFLPQRQGIAPEIERRATDAPDRTANATPSALDGRPAVLRFDVDHARRIGQSALQVGLMGGTSFTAQYGDRAKVRVDLSRPAYGYLLAYAANGKEFLLDPPSDAERPKQAQTLVYPQPGMGVEYELNDDAGLHTFLAVVSNEPLPTYAQWRTLHGSTPWSKSPGRPGAVWRRLGDELAAVTAVRPDVRGPGAKELGNEPLERLVSWWQMRPGIAQVGLTAFAVVRE